MNYFFQKSTDFTKFSNMIIDWNATGRQGKHDFSEKTIDFQKKLVKDELDEMMEAFENKDATELLKEMCDVFVVASYWHFLTTGKKEKPQVLMLPALYDIDYFTQIKYDFETLESPYLVLQDIMILLNSFNADTTSALLEVIDSNYSKFPFTSEIYNTDIECKRIEEEFKGRYKGVTVQTFNDHLIFKSDAGKILKPVTYRDADVKKFLHFGV